MTHSLLNIIVIIISFYSGAKVGVYTSSCGSDVHQIDVIHQIDTKNEWLLLPARFTAKFGLVFVLALENAFS